MQDIIIGADHRGFELKEQVKAFLREKKLFFVDCGTNSTATVDYPNVVKEVVECVLSAKHFCGILICGSGIGVSMAANRYKGIRAALCSTVGVAKSARAHSDANVLCLGADEADFENVKKVVTAFLNTKPDPDPKYRRRIELLDKL
jgi:ribose 5-phosphate isomerase B